MQSFRQPSDPDLVNPSISASVPVDLALVAGTLPLLAFVIGTQWIAAGFTEIGKASEELFRGDRLPIRPLMKVSSREKPPT